MTISNLFTECSGLSGVEVRGKEDLRI